MLIKFFPIDVTYKVVRGMPVIHLYGRTSDGRRVCVADSSFEPYFWVVNGQRDDVERISVQQPGGEVRVKRVEQHQKKYLGSSVNALKVFAGLPSDVPLLRRAASMYGAALEADIPFARRYLIDKGIVPMMACEVEGEFEHNPSYRVPVFRAASVSESSEEVAEALRIVSFDIETHSPLGKEISPAEQPVIMLGVASDGFRRVITWKRFDTRLDYVEFVDDERQLLERFVQLVEELQPDVLAGYYSDGFDFPFMLARAARNNVQLPIGLDFSQPRAAKSQVDVAGVVHLDVLKFIRKIFGRYMETPVFDLNSVAVEILGEGKHGIGLDGLWNAWENNVGLEDYCRYNVQDAVLTGKLAQRLFPNMVELVRVVGMPLADVSRMSFSQLVEWYLLGQAKSFGELAPNRPEYVETRQRLERTFEGAYVHEPTPGLYSDVAVFDFRSLYPTIISAHNISPDMLNCGCCDQAFAPGLKFWFCSKRRGLISSVIEGLITRRMRIKELLKSAEDRKLLKAREEALKTIANSIYGYFGFFGARWYSMECAQSITAFGRDYIMGVIARARERFGVLYSDTDSIFLTLEGKDRRDAERFVAEINRELPGLMELEFQGFYPAGLFVGTREGGIGAKKKYALITEEGNIRIKGFEAVRRNLSPIAKETQERVLEIVLKERAPQKALEYISAIVSAARNREIPAQKMIITTQLQKDLASYDSIAPHVAVAQRMRQQGRQVLVGSMIRYIVTAGKDRIRDRAKLPGEVKGNDYDFEYYINNQILPSVERIMAVFGIDIIREVEPLHQKRLDAFFG